MAIESAAADFGGQLKGWRQLRKVSQLDLALDASVSQRHLSWLETGKSQPSRGMVIQLAEALDVPLRARNKLLTSAGYAPVYSETNIDAAAMAPVYDALKTMLAHHEPLPSLVVDRLWHIVMTNGAADRLLGLFGDVEEMWRKVDPSGQRSLARLTLHQDGLRPFIVNWQDALPAFAHRLRRDAYASGSEDERAEFQSLMELFTLEEQELADERNEILPVLPLVLQVGDTRLSLFSVISTFGTPHDVTVDELRIESFFPSDDATAQFFVGLITGMLQR